MVSFNVVHLSADNVDLNEWNMDGKNGFSGVFIFLLVIFSLNFYSAKFAASEVVKAISYGYMLGAVLISLRHFFKKATGFVFPVQLICISILFSILMAYMSWGQGFSYSKTTVPFLVWFVFFYLLRIRYPINRLENIIIFYGFLYIALYFFQFLHNDVVYFGFAEEFAEDRGVIRINFPGAGVFFLAFFIALNRSSGDGKYRWLFVFFLCLGVIVTVLQVTRQSIAILLAISLFHVMCNTSIFKRTIILVSFLAALLYFLNSDSSIYKGLAETQRETMSEGSQYIRVVAAEYFVKDFSPNIFSRILGNGFPNITSDYGKFTYSLADTYGFYASDIGLLGLYVQFGIFPVLAYIFIFFKSLAMQVPRNFYYLKYYMVFLLFTCLTSDNTYSMNFMFTNIFVLYCFQVIYEQKKGQSLNY
jgi:hypothetical protein